MIENNTEFTSRNMTKKKGGIVIRFARRRVDSKRDPILTYPACVQTQDMKENCAGPPMTAFRMALTRAKTLQRYFQKENTRYAIPVPSRDPTTSSSR